jgi:hypothetical protein
MPNSSKIIKVAGWSFVGFCAVSLVADKVAFGSEAAQVAGYCGAALGALVGRGRGSRRRERADSAEPIPPSAPAELTAPQPTEPVSVVEPEQ